MTRAPYKYLDYYEFEDADLFFGRESEVQRMVGEILTSRLLVLFSPSGSGKTSLINAGVRPALEKLEYATAYVRFDKPPVQAVLNAVSKRLDQPVAPEAENLHHWFSQFYQNDAIADKPPTVIFLDQFEEFFIVYQDQPRVRREFIAQLAKIKYDADLPVFVVLSLREDYFVNLHEFRQDVPSIFQNNANIRLRPFSDAEARRAILKPAAAVGLHYEDGLTETLIHDLKGETPGQTGVEPIALQMVCHTLYQKKNGADGPMTRALYDQCGGAKTIIATRLSEALDSIPRRDRGLMMKLFHAMKTPDELKRYRSLSDLREALRQKDPRRLQKLLDRLTAREVLRHEQRKQQHWYEFKHDYLVPKVADWIRRQEQAQQQKRMRYAIAPGAALALILFIWAFINFFTFESHFSNPEYDNQEREVVIRRAFNPFGFEIGTGIRRSELRGIDARNEVENGAAMTMWSENDLQRVAGLLPALEAGWWLYKTGETDNGLDSLIAALKDQNSSVRSRAAETLGELGKNDPVEQQLKNLTHHASGYRTLAIEAIARRDTISAKLEQAVRNLRDTSSQPWTRIAAWDAYERIQQRRQQDREDSLARAQADSLFRRADSLRNAQDYAQAQSAFSRAFERLFKTEDVFL